MGMTGKYIAVDDAALKRIIDGDQGILSTDTQQYPALDIDKSWHALYHILCYDSDEENSSMEYVLPMTNDSFIECETDFSAFYITAEQVKAGADALALLDDDTFQKLYDFEWLKENEVYPITEEDTEDGFYSYIHPYLAQLKQYFQQAAQQGSAMVFYIM